MTRTVVTATTILLLAICVGCESPDQGRSQMLAQRGTPYAETSAPAPVEVAASADEIDLVEQLASQRQAYRHSLETLIQHYDIAGNNQKVVWAKAELRALDQIPQYRYVVEAQVLAPDLKATARIQAADDLYAEAAKMKLQAGVLPVLKNEEVLRGAMTKFTSLIQRYPTSDKIDDAAYNIGEIHEYFKDYTLALSSYQRAFQWDQSTPYPARFKAAYILDNRLHRRAEAVQLYEEAVVKEAQHADWKAYAERRIKELNRSDTGAQ